MSKKHFSKFADAIRQITDKGERKRTADLVGLVCAKSNSSFDWVRWYKTCEVG